MSCHSRDGYRAAVRLACALTGTDRPAAEKLLHDLRAQATGADLPAPGQDDIDEWYRDSLVALDASGLAGPDKDRLARALMRARYETPPPDGRDFHAQARLLDRARAQAVVDTAPGIVGLDPPGSQAHLYQRGPDGRPANVWYASYGSNLYAERFGCYITGGSPNNGRTVYPGCRDTAAPAADIPVALPGQVHFAGESTVWGGGVAFLDPDAAGRSLGRAYLVTADQFDDVVCQESNSGSEITGDKVDLNAAVAAGRVQGPGVYGTLVHVGDHQGAPVMTFTGPFAARDALRGDLVYTPDKTLAPAAGRAAAQADQVRAQADENAQAAAENRPAKRLPADWPVVAAPPSAAYRQMISGGLAQTYGLDPDRIGAYFAGSVPAPAAAPDTAAAAA